jgi:hypothetical protein
LKEFPPELRKKLGILDPKARVDTAVTSVEEVLEWVKVAYEEIAIFVSRHIEGPTALTTADPGGRVDLFGAQVEPSAVNAECCWPCFIKLIPKADMARREA